MIEHRISRVCKSLPCYINGSPMIRMLLVMCNQQQSHWSGYMRLNQQMSKPLSQAPPSFLSCAVRMYGVPKREATYLCLYASTVFIPGFVQIACMPRGSHEYSLHRTRSVKEQTTLVTCKRKRLLTANYRCKSGVRAKVCTQFTRHPTSPIQFVAVSCLSCTCAQFYFQWFINLFLTFS